MLICFYVLNDAVKVCYRIDVRKCSKGKTQDKIETTLFMEDKPATNFDFNTRSLQMLGFHYTFFDRRKNCW